MVFFKTLQKIIYPIIIVVAFLIFVIYSIYNRLWHFMLANIMVFILLFLPSFIKKSSKLKIPVELEVLFFGSLLLTFLLGQIDPLFIQIMFGLFIGLAGFILINTFLPKYEKKTNYLFIIFLAFCISISLATTIEIGKYCLKLILGLGNTQADYIFGMKNLIFVAIGSLISTGFGFIYYKLPKNKNFLKKIVMRIKNANPSIFLNNSNKIERVLEDIRKGEGDGKEFKSTLRINLHTQQPDKRVELATLRAISSFMNSKGGCIFLGIDDSGKIVGLEKDGFENMDFFNRHLTNLIKEKIGPENLPYLNFSFFKLKDKTFLRINCQKSKKPVFTKTEQGDSFFVRAGASTIQLEGLKLINYISSNFKI